MVDSWLSAAAQEAMFQVEAVGPAKKNTFREGLDERCALAEAPNPFSFIPQTPQWSLQAHFQG